MRTFVRPDENGRRNYIVRYTEPPLALNTGQLIQPAGIRMEATNPAARGDDRLDADSPASQAYLEFLEQQQTDRLARIEQMLERDVEVVRTYRAAFNGAVMNLAAGEAERLLELPGVADVQPEFILHPQTDRGPEFIGADAVWDGSFGGPATLGEGVVVAVLDTGLNLKNNHPSFAATGADGFTITNPLGEGVFRGRCNPDDPNFDPELQCNGKVIGAYSFTQDDTPDDENGHGSHVASTAVGNFVEGVTIPGTTAVVDVSGVAPHANMMIYDVCDDDFTGACPGSAILGAIDQVVLDADIVDVVNFSIGGGSNDPWEDADAQAYLGARAAGIVVATSAGNSGPGAATVGSPADAPWLTSVANQTHDRLLFGTDVSVTGPGSVPADLEGIPALEGTGPALAAPLDETIVFDGTNPEGCSAFDAGTFTDSIALISRGSCVFADKVTNATDAGAVAVVVFNNVPGAAPSVMGGLDDTTIPAVMVGNDDGLALRDWVQGSADPTVNVNPNNDGTAPFSSLGNRMAGSSSRGPNPAVADILKPNVSAPGSGIFAALGNMSSLGDTWGFLSGTSMASPHVAGSAALVRALHPDWTPAEVHSALVMKAQDAEDIVKEDGQTPSDPFDRGGGRVDPGQAASALLVLNETGTAFTNADPDAGGDPRSLNLPELADGQCIRTCSWTRTFRMVEDGIVNGFRPTETSWEIDLSDVPVGAQFTATPSTFTLTAGQSQTVTFEADFSATEAEQWHFGFVNLDLTGAVVSIGGSLQNQSDAPGHQRLPVAVFSTDGTFPDPAVIETRRDTGSRLFTGLESIAIDSLQVDSSGLVEATVTDLELDRDPTANPFDDFSQVFLKQVAVPADTPRLVAEIDSAEAPDADLFVVNFDTGMVPCVSQTAGSSTERCDLREPAAGNYGIVVQNFTGSGDQPDAIRLYDAVVPPASGADPSLTATGPAGSVAQGEAWDLAVGFDIDSGSQAGRWFGALALGSAAGNSGDVFTIPVDLIRRSDDVVKLADVEQVEPGDIVNYTIFVDSNVTENVLVYSIDDLVPDGLQLDPDSVSVDRGTVTVNGDQIEWGFEMPPPTLTYQVSTNATNPSCDTGFDGYINLQDFGVSPSDLGQDLVDTTVFDVFGEGLPIDLFGVPLDGIGFTDDGFVVGDSANNFGGAPWVPQSIPDAALPNNLAAMLWQDMEIVNDPANFKGVSLATAGPDTIVIEYDDVQPFQGDGTVTWDFEVVIRRTPSDEPGAFEYVFAYNNLSPLDNPITVGMENAAGDEGTALVNNQAPGDAITDTTMVCFDRVELDASASLTYSAEVVQALGPFDIFITNEAMHLTDNPGDETAIADETIVVRDDDILFRDDFDIRN